jgi:PTH1 family peptidyl-tRNA hydrolase
MAGLRLIVGLDPGAEHARTAQRRVLVVTPWLLGGGPLRLESKLHGSSPRSRAVGTPSGFKLATFMNLSGRSVAAALRYWKIEPEVLIAHDELDLEPGTARLKFDGGHGGQNGLRDTIQHLGHGRFHRLRVGIGHPGHKDKVTPWSGRLGKDDEASMLGIDEAIEVLPGKPGTSTGNETVAHRRPVASALRNCPRGLPQRHASGIHIKCGIVGPPVGKSTLFNALTKAGIAAPTTPSARSSPTRGSCRCPICG